LSHPQAVHFGTRWPARVSGTWQAGKLHCEKSLQLYKNKNLKRNSLRTQKHKNYYRLVLFAIFKILLPNQMQNYEIKNYYMFNSKYIVQLIFFEYKNIFKTLL